jgi:hypothetical protein
MVSSCISLGTPSIPLVTYLSGRRICPQEKAPPKRGYDSENVDMAAGTRGGRSGRAFQRASVLSVPATRRGPSQRRRAAEGVVQNYSDVCLTNRDSMHLSAVGAVDLHGCRPTCAKALWIGLDSGGCLLVCCRTEEPQCAHGGVPSQRSGEQRAAAVDCSQGRNFLSDDRFD